jgi:putative membrane protein
LKANHRVPLLCLAVTLAVLVWSGITPKDRLTWWMEVAPVLMALPILLFTYRRFRLTDFLYVLIALHGAVLMVGGHYTYAEVPLFDWIRDVTGGTRNSYDGVGHFMQGFVPAFVIRELMLRTSPLRAGFWLGAVMLLSCLGISALSELIEWLAALLAGGTADAFLGLQGDVWDTQKDMAMAGVGALCALLSARWHDRGLAKLNNVYTIIAREDRF